MRIVRDICRVHTLSAAHASASAAASASAEGGPVA